jgi:predicted deacylase
MRRHGDRLKAHGITIDSNLECGAVENLRWVQGVWNDPLICFEAPKDGSPQGMWWRFRVRAAKGRRIWFHLTNLPEILGGTELDKAVPVLRQRGGNWQRLDPENCRKLGPHGPFEFVVDFKSDDVELAWGYPYGLSDFAHFLKSLPASSRKLLKVSRIGTSAEGRELKMVTIGKSNRSEMKPAIWVTARNHAGEVAGSWGIEGLLRKLSSGDAAARWLRRHCVVHAVPFVDLDSVIEGRYGKDHVPLDPNRDWSAGSIRPETKAVIAAVQASRSHELPSVLVDLHCPGAGEPKSYPVLPNPSSLAEWQKTAFLARCAERAAPHDFPVRVRDWTIKTINWGSWLSAGTTCNWARDAGMTAITFELTYNRTVRGNLATSKDYCGFGAGLVKALVAFMKHQASGKSFPRTAIPRLPRARGWLTRRLPEKATISSGADGAAKIKGQGPGSCLVLRSNKTLVSRGGQAVFVLETDNRTGKSLEIKMVLLPRTRAGYWCGYLIEKKLTLRPGRCSKQLSLPLKRGAVVFRVGLEVMDFKGQLEINIKSC